MLRILFLILSLLSIQSCGPKKSSEAQFVINIGALAENGDYPGGVIIYGHNSTGTQRFSRAITTASYNIELENGEWSFYALAWEGPYVFEGDLKCAHTVARLNGEPVTISLAPQIASCDSDKFSPPVLRQDGLIQPLKFVTCSDLLSHISDPTCSQSPGLHQSVEVVLNSYEGRSSLDRSQFGDPLKSQCINLTSDLSSTNLIVPLGSPFFDISAEIHAYVGPNCSGTFKNVFHFPRGLFQGNLTNALVLDDPGSAGAIDYTKIFLKSDFNLNRPTLSYNSFVGSINTQINISPQSINLGGATSGTCSAANLPSGLIIDSSTCVISGSLSTALTQTNYPVILTTADGLSVTVNVSLTVQSTITNPGNTTTNTLALNYPSTPQSLTVGTSTTITPTINSGNTASSNISSCTTHPLLPYGLQINGNTCVISGTPIMAQSATNYTVTVTTAAGLSNTGTVSIAVSAITPTISYSASTGNIHTARTITPTVNAGGSTISNCTATLPAGLSIAPTTCIISGTPTASQTATNHTVTITTAAGLSNTGTVSITVSPIAPALTYASASGTVNSVLTINPSSINNNGASITSCTTSGLPTGLSVNSSCVISGTPTTAGSASYTITATNSAGSTNAAITITIAAIAPTLSYSGASGTSGQVNTAMSISPTGLTTGGASISNCTGSLPPGLSINATTCVISGTPTWAQTSTSHTITIRNSSNLTSTATVSITIAAILPTISFSAASTGNVGIARTITPTTYNGGTNISNCTVSPLLPVGLSINTSTCVISGTPTTASSALYTITATNSVGSTNATITITIAAIAPTLSYSGASGTLGLVNTAMSISPTSLTTGGSNISNCTASLPTGLTIAPTTCVISGIPTASQTATNHIVTITTAHGLSNTGIVSITVNSNTGTAGSTTTNTFVLNYPQSPQFLLPEPDNYISIHPTFNTGGANVTSCITIPPLPDGLQIDQYTCEIFGTPTTSIGLQNYIVTASTFNGSGTGSISIGVAAISPSISYTEITGQVLMQMSITPYLTTGGSTISNCTATLPDGLTISPTTCVISGTPINPQNATNTTVIVTTSAGLQATGVVPITIGPYTPQAPTPVSLANPISSPGISKTPSIIVNGVLSGYTVSLYSSSTCSGSAIGSAVSNGTSVNVKVSAPLSVPSSNYFFARSINSIGVSSSCSNNSIRYDVINCPTGFIPIPHDTQVGSYNDFCVMKYEAKSDGNGGAVSKPQDVPLVGLSPNDAQQMCNQLGSEFDIISNPEWMTIARNAESESQNWSMGIVGSGHMSRGWSASSNNFTNLSNSTDPSISGGYNPYPATYSNNPLLGFADSWDNVSVAPNGDSSCKYNSSTTGSCSNYGSHLYKRTFHLSNGEEIWDFSGNVWELVDWDPTNSGFQSMPQNWNYSCAFYNNNGFSEVGDIFNSGCNYIYNSQYNYYELTFNHDELFPLNTNFFSAHGIGRFGLSYLGYAIRGGGWTDGADAGAFSFATVGLSSQNNTGFRCVYRP